MGLLWKCGGGGVRWLQGHVVLWGMARGGGSAMGSDRGDAGGRHGLGGARDAALWGCSGGVQGNVVT